MLSRWLFPVIAGAVLAVGFASAADMSKWDAAYDPATGTRFIPVELWTGGEWDGSRELQMTKADLVFGNRGENRIRGPVTWVRPGTGEQIQVYERTNRGKGQLFTLNARGDGLGRVYDSRYPRDCFEETKFPLGVWKQGETRVFEISCNEGKMRRRIQLTIENIDFEYNGVPHTLRFHWLVDSGRERGTDMTYIYSPGHGLVYVNGNE